MEENEDELSVVEYVFRDSYNFFTDDEASDDDLIVQVKNKLVVDIDAPDVDDELAAVEYVLDLYRFYDATENDGRVDHDYMGSQKEINKKMRAILVDWLIGVHVAFQLMPEVLYLAVNILDRFLSVTNDIRRTELQLVGMCSMLIASKYEHDDGAPDCPEVINFIDMSNYAYVIEQVLRMEEAILWKLEWCLSVPTPYVYLVRFIKASSIPAADVEMEKMAFFYAEIGLMIYWTVISNKPSMLAASAVYAARWTLNRSPLWTDTLKYYTRYSEDQLMGHARLLVGFHSDKEENKLKFVSHRKYSDPERGADGGSGWTDWTLAHPISKFSQKKKLNFFNDYSQILPPPLGAVALFLS